MKYEESMLSGFIDGELSPAEEQVVQRQLAASPKDRQLLESLSKLHAQLRAAPPEVFSSDPVAAVRSRIAQGDPDSIAQVAAAKNLRAGSRNDKQQPQAADPQQTAQQPTARQPNARDGWRITRWLALAVAASLAGLLLWLPQRQAQTLTDNLAPSARPAPKGRITVEPTAVSPQASQPADSQPADSQPAETELDKADGSLELAPSAAPEPAAEPADQLQKAAPGSRSARMLATAGDQASTASSKPFRIGRAGDEVLAPLEQPLSAELADELSRRFVALELPANTHSIAARFIADQLRSGGESVALGVQPATDSVLDADKALGAARAVGRLGVVDADRAGVGRGAVAGTGGYVASASTATAGENSPTAILVEGTPEELASLVQSLQQWSIGGGERRLSDYQARGPESSFALNSYAASESAGAGAAVDVTTTPLAELGPEVREGVLAGRLWIVLRSLPANPADQPPADQPQRQP